MLISTTVFCLASLWVSAFQRALDSSAEWTMERRLAEGARPLVSSGRVDCVAQSGIVWRVTAPFPSSVAMTRDAMVFADEEGVRTRKTSDMPHYEEIRKRTDAFVAGDTKAYDGLFGIDAHEGANGTWTVSLTPEMNEMRRLFVRVDLSGAAYPTNATFRYANGGSSSIWLRSVPRVR